MEGRIKECKLHLRIGADKERLIRHKGNINRRHRAKEHKEAVREDPDPPRNATHQHRLEATGQIAVDPPCKSCLDFVFRCT